jgi:hypothetical protein
MLDQSKRLDSAMTDKGMSDMGAEPRCAKCKKEWEEFGAILVSPPKEDTTVEKFYLCGLCYDEVIASCRISN